MPPLHVDEAQRIILAIRPGETVSDLQSLRLYDKVFQLTGDDLRLSRKDLTPDDWDRCAGWPVLLSPACGREGDDPDESQLAVYLASDCLADLDDGILSSLLTDDGTIASGLADRLPPLAHPETAACRRLRLALPEAATRLLLERMAVKGGASRTIAAALRRRPQSLTLFLRQLVERQKHDEALALFCASGGWFLYYRLGPEVFHDLIRLLEADWQEMPEELVISRALLAIKRGEVAWAIHALSQRFGANFRDALAVCSSADGFSLRLRLFRMTVLIYEDVTPSDRLLEALFALGHDLPPDEPEQRGSFYNAMLEFFLRLRRYEEADGMAEKAMQAYREADSPLLCFYIALHRSVLGLLVSDPDRIATSLSLAHQMLATIGYDSPGDERLLRLVAACAAYENGAPETLLTFLDGDMRVLSDGEIWPSMVDIALYYGSLALSEHGGSRAALRFLDRWGVYQALNRQFRLSLEIRKAQILQSGNHWGEAARILTPLGMRYNRVWIESAEEALTRLTSRDDILMALSWLRQIVYERPDFPHLERKLEAMRANPRLLLRQEIALLIWQAYVARQMRQPSITRTLMRQVFELCARHGGLPALAEERLFLDVLLEDRRLADFLMAATPARGILRRLDRGRHNSLAAARSKLTRQELKILLLLAEGASNKLIARNCGLSEATVKFHLKNIYRKLGCSRRNEAIATARALGWLR
ncbi:LuxR C-terminal-related transcriptional regulator [Allorhizobium sp. BGMRC 0089]|uniref:LuxR family transcriptional regulator n=1 Tax=Allorhizobium sonneratiae TaxID=2934936 RepID=UPI0020341E9A|nr:LuxR family transcriptional regulator [Allorhizobium sonneratiae]MCM2293155.1 LuxR C-terminal-related transcriptional regulator [Allorhizobium sonneratiae]